jgi:hypothetical protein
MDIWVSVVSFARAVAVGIGRALMSEDLALLADEWVSGARPAKMARDH